MSFDQQFSLLSLGGGVENLLLSYVSSGSGGLNAILNLRQVCSKTKNWIDDLPPRQAKQIFAKTQANVVFCNNGYPHYSLNRKQTFEKIQEFLNNPPPLNVNSLNLSGAESFAKTTFSPAEEQLWRRFAAFWWERLESLEVDYFDNLLRPMESRVNQLLTAPSLRRLLCHKLEDRHADPLELPQSLFYVEHLCIVNLYWFSSIRLTQFFESLARAPRLKSFKMSIWQMRHVEEITRFLVLTKDKVNLELIFTQEYSFPMKSTPHGTDHLPPSFVSAIAASSASIRLLLLGGDQLEGLEERVGEETANKFFKTVEWIGLFDTTQGENRLVRFTNLKRLDFLRISGSEVESILFPPNLQQLTIKSGFPKNLPPSLTSLAIGECRSTVTELAESLKTLDKQCPLLKSLKIVWTGDESLEVLCVCCNNGTQQESQSKTPFRNMKSLKFHLKASSLTRVPANLNGARWILMNGFHLPQLSLIELELTFCGDTSDGLPPVLDLNAMKSLVCGKIMKSLVSVAIEDSFVTWYEDDEEDKPQAYQMDGNEEDEEEVLSLKGTLEATVEENAEKLEKLVGSKKFSSLFN